MVPNSYWFNCISYNIGGGKRWELKGLSRKGIGGHFFLGKLDIGERVLPHRVILL